MPHGIVELWLTARGSTFSLNTQATPFPAIKAAQHSLSQNLTYNNASSGHTNGHPANQILPNNVYNFDFFPARAAVLRNTSGPSVQRHQQPTRASTRRLCPANINSIQSQAEPGTSSSSRNSRPFLGRLTHLSPSDTCLTRPRTCG